jgi:hypothetical protein
MTDEKEEKAGDIYEKEIHLRERGHFSTKITPVS